MTTFPACLQNLSYLDKLRVEYQPSQYGVKNSQKEDRS